LLIDPEDYSKKSEKEFLEDTSQITWIGEIFIWLTTILETKL
jgi:hypothetical protein